MKGARDRKFGVLAMASFACLLSGCGAKDDWMPMEVGKTWTYQVTGEFDRHIAPIKVSQEVTVASRNGFELAGPLGASRLAWKSGTLVAESTVNARFVPEIPLLIPGVDLVKDHPKQVATWHGRVTVLGKEHPASAVLTEQPDTVDLSTRKVQTILATLKVRLPGGLIELDSWYQQGVGLVQQEQRTKGTRIVQLVLIGHP